jgi:hypothetical protein
MVVLYGTIVWLSTFIILSLTSQDQTLIFLSYLQFIPSARYLENTRKTFVLMIMQLRHKIPPYNTTMQEHHTIKLLACG